MLDAYRDLIDELLGTPTAVRALVEEGGDVPTASVALIAGLRDRDVAVLKRLQAIMREPGALLPVLKDDAPTGDEPLAEVISGLDTARGELVSLLMNLTLKDWARTATHEIEGEIALADEVERHVDFDERRVAAIGASLAARP